MSNGRILLFALFGINTRSIDRIVNEEMGCRDVRKWKSLKKHLE
jgi:hypothetical protein